MRRIGGDAEELHVAPEIALYVLAVLRIHRVHLAIGCRWREKWRNEELCESEATKLAKEGENGKS